MNVWNKVKSFLSRKESRTVGVISSSNTGGVIWPSKNYDNFAKETYLKNVTAFRAIDEVSKSVASVPWVEKEKSGKDVHIVEDSDITSILTRPNPSESFNWVMLRATAFLVMAGNAFLERIGPSTGPNKGNVKELYSLRPDRIKMLTDQSTGRLRGYRYSIGEDKEDFEIDPVTGQSDLLQLKTFHPLDDWWGMGATEPASRNIDTSNAAIEWNKSLLDNQGRPGMIYSLVGALGEESFDELERQLRENHGGPQNVGKDLIIVGDKGTTATPYGWSPADMDFAEGDLREMRKIAMGYGVPPMILGIPGEATFANFKEARLAMWESTILWWLSYIKGELNNWFYGGVPNNKRYVDYVLDEVPALSIRRDALWDRAQNADHISINEKRKMTGQDSWGDAGDVILVDSGKVPLELISDIGDGEDEETRKGLLKQGFNDTEINEMFGETY